MTSHQQNGCRPAEISQRQICLQSHLGEPFAVQKNLALDLPDAFPAGCIFPVERKLKHTIPDVIDLAACHVMCRCAAVDQRGNGWNELHTHLRLPAASLSQCRMIPRGGVKWNFEIFVSALDSWKKYEVSHRHLTASAKQDSAAKNRTSVSNSRFIRFPLIRASRLLLSAASNLAARMRSSYSIRARDRHAALHLRSRTRPQPVEAIPGWGTLSHHCEATAT